MQDFFSKMTRGQLIRLVSLILGVIVVAIVAIVLLNRTTYAELYQSNDPAEMGRINTYLKEQNILTRINGNTLSVPEADRDSLRWDLAMQGYFDGGGFTTEILEQGLGIAATEETTRTFEILQTARDLEVVFNKSPKVRSSHVILDIAERSPYLISKDNQSSSASVMIVRENATMPLDTMEAEAIRSLVRGAHSTLNDDNIIIVDNNLHVYDRTDPSEALLMVNNDRLGLKDSIEVRLEKALVDLFEPVFGKDMVNAAVAVELDFDKRTTESVVFAPPVEGETSGIPIAIQRLTETIRGSTALAQGEPGLDENGGAPSYVENTASGTDNIYEKLSENINMEVNETKTLVESAQGTVVKITAAIIIPLDEAAEDYTVTVQDLAAKALGITNIDNVSVKRLPLHQDDWSAAFDKLEAEKQGARDYEMQRLIIILLAIVFVTLLMLLALRIVLKALRPPAPVPVVVEPLGTAAMAAGGGAPGQGIDLVTPDDDEAAALAAEGAEDAAGGASGVGNEDAGPTQEEILAAQLEELMGDTRPDDNSLTQVQRFIEKDPESVAQLLRNWLTDEFR